MIHGVKSVGKATGCCCCPCDGSSSAAAAAAAAALDRVYWYISVSGRRQTGFLPGFAK